MSQPNDAVTPPEHGALHYAVTRALAASKSIPEAAVSVLDEICTRLGVSYGSLWLVNEVGGRLIPLTTWPSTDTAFRDATLSRTFKPGEGLPGHVWETAAFRRMASLTEAPDFPRAAAAEASGLREAIAFPVVVAQKTAAVVELFSDRANGLPASLENTLTAVGLQIGEFIARVRATEAERASRMTVEATLQAALDSVVMIDATGRVLEFNKVAEETFGYSRQRAIGSMMVELIVPHHLREAHTRGMARYLATGEARVLGRRIEITALRSDGTEFPVELGIQRVPVDGPPIFTAYIRDLTEHKRMISTLERQAAMLEAQTVEMEKAVHDANEANEAKSSFLASMSHELRTPLNAILGYAQLLEVGVRGQLTAPQLEDIGRMKRSAQHLLALINDILNFAKLEAGRVEVRYESLALGPVLSRVRELVEPQTRAKKLRLEFRDETAGARACGDADKIMQILVNLLSNAIRHTDEGGRVEVVARATAANVVAEVCDTGQGIPTDRFEDIFAAFIQLNRSYSGEQEGTGLGLAISRDLARAMRGDLTVASTVGKGSTFTLTLPREVSAKSGA
jgi:PAS domain S-box-containing protein